MHKFAFTLLSLLLAVSLSAGIVRQGNGLISVDKQTFGLFHFGPKWHKYTSQIEKPYLVQFAGENAQETAKGGRRVGSWQTQWGTFTVVETAKIGEREAYLGMEFSSADGVPTEQLSYLTVIPNDVYKRHPVSIDGEVVAYGTKGVHRPSEKETEIKIPMDGGTLHIKGVFTTGIQFNENNVDLRLIVPGSGTIRKKELNLTFRYVPLPSVTVDLRSAANMGLADKVADDKKGGWTDQGPQNDLSKFIPGKKEFGGIEFDVADAAQNNGKSIIALKGGARPYFTERAKVELREPVSGRFLYLLNSLAWAGPLKMGSPAGEVDVVYADDSKATLKLEVRRHVADFWTPVKLEKSFVAWRSSNESASVGLYATWLELDPAKKVKSLEFKSVGQVWLILAATITSKEPGKSALWEKVVIKADHNEWLPLTFKPLTEKGSVMDISHQLDAPAGKYGFVVAKPNGTFEFEKRPGVPVRFWGANICMQTCFVDRDKSREIMEDLAAWGYNTVRYHHFDQGSGWVWMTDDDLDKLFYQQAEARKRGIYATIDLYTLRKMTLPKYGNVKEAEFKMLCYMTDESDEAYVDLMRFTEKLMTTVNPYTGLAWKDDPAITHISLINESSLTTRIHQVSPLTRPIVERAFAKWCRENGRGGDREKLLNEFLEFAAKRFYNRITKDLREMGVRIPFTDQNMVITDTTQKARLTYDYVDSHFYWGHPIHLGGPRSSWNWLMNSNSIITDWGGETKESIRIRILGKPNTISEWCYCHPNPFSAEEQVIMPALAGMQGFDGLYHFGYAHTRLDKPETIGMYDTVYNPVKRVGVRVGSMLFLRRDVAESEVVLPYRLGDRVSYGPLVTVAKCGMLDPANPPKEKPVPGNLTANELIANLIAEKRIPANSYDAEKQIARSTTGELEMNHADTTFRVVTPKTEAFVLPQGGNMAGNIMSVKNRKVNAVFAIAAVDGQPLKSSERMLLAHMTENRNVGGEYVAPEMSIWTKEGTTEIVVRRGIAEIELALPNVKTIHACDFSGKRLFEVALTREDGKTFLTADTKTDHGPVAVYEVVR